MAVPRLRASDNGNAFIGLYCACSDKLALIGPSCSSALETACVDALAVPVERASVAGSNLLGIFCALNSNGIIVPEQVEKAEVKRFKDLGLNVLVLKGALNACGNIIAANDKGALADLRLKKEDVKKIGECLGVEAMQGSIAGYETVGACTLVSNKGFAAHNSAHEDEVALLASALKVGGSIATANMGVSFLRPCGIVNSKGYVMGERTSGYELSRLDEALGFVGD